MTVVHLDSVDLDGVDPDSVDPDGVDPDGVDPDGVDLDGVDPDSAALPVPAPVPVIPDIASAPRRSHPSATVDVVSSMQEYLGRQDWRVSANANQGYSLGGLILNVSGKVVANYWLSHVYPEAVGRAHRDGDLHLHDLDMFAGYCAGWSLRSLLVDGVVAGVGGYEPKGEKRAPPIRSCRDYPADGDKRVPDLKTALKKCGLRDGMTISTHHHLRNGDAVALLALTAAAELGARDLMWFPSASFPCHEPVIELMQAGAVHHIEGSMNGPLGDYCSQGKMRGLGVLRSHGGRWQAIQDGEVRIDIAVIAAPTADAFGNCVTVFVTKPCCL